MSRRISSNRGFVGLPLGGNDDEDEETNEKDLSTHSNISRRRSLGGRRRSSFGSHSSKSPGSAVEQSRIAEMYKNVIKLSFENKINDKNSWNLDLIDHMGNLIKGDAAGTMGVNFQKASFTLDASVKIYSCRVDDTHSSSQSMVQSLGRGFDQGAVTNEDNQGHGGARVGTKVASSKLNIANTIATNVDTINAAKIERIQVTDPMFHRMSKAFDEGGAKGMLMNNLRVSSTGCTLSFFSPKESDPSTADTSAAPSDPPAAVSVSPFDRIDISDLISRCGFDAASLLSMSICPALTTYRESIGIEDNLTGAFDPHDFISVFGSTVYDDSSMSMSENLNEKEDPVPMDSNSSNDFDYVSDENDDDNDDNEAAMDFEEGGFHDFSPAKLPSSARKSMGIALNRRSSVNGLGHKINWGDESDKDRDSQSAAAMAPSTPRVKDRSDSISSGGIQSVVWDASGISSSNDYSFFDIDTVNKSNSWAGARHWKYATRRQVATVSAVDSSDVTDTRVTDRAVDEDGEGDEGKPVITIKTSKAVKEKFTLRPLSEAPDEELFVMPKSRGSDVTSLTAAALEKEAVLAEAGGLFLPPDAKLQTSDLCRLMLCQNIIVPPPHLAQAFLKQVISSSSSRRSKAKSGDVIWGQARRVPTAVSSGGFVPTTHADMDDDDDDDDGGGYGEDFCDPDGDDICHDSGSNNGNGGGRENEADVIAASMEKGLFISSEGLLRAARTVDRIDIGFATVAKKVNVKRLKSDIWTHLDELEPRPSGSFSVRDSHFSSVKSSRYDSMEGGEMNRKRDRQSLCSDEISFQDLVCDISGEQRQKDVTLPFYFICLLHLANEKTLRIDGSPDMTDLFISKDG